VIEGNFTGADAGMVCFAVSQCSELLTVGIPKRRIGGFVHRGDVPDRRRAIRATHPGSAALGVLREGIETQHVLATLAEIAVCACPARSPSAPRSGFYCSRSI
jgi:hypothetical protein